MALPVMGLSGKKRDIAKQLGHVKWTLLSNPTTTSQSLLISLADSLIELLFFYFFQPLAPKGSSGYLDAYRDEWREVFMISAEIYIFGIIIYLLLGSGEKQYWADGVKPKGLPDTDSKPITDEEDIKPVGVQ